MNILIVNDDGINADGIKVLANTLKSKHKVTVVAPESERSAAGPSYSFARPISFEKINKPGFDGVDTYITSGTPCDCVILGLDKLGRENVDLVLSGINAGANLGTDIPASGTVNAALEGAMRGVPSMAVSQEIKKLVSFEDYNEYYEYAAKYTKKFIAGYDFSQLNGYILSMNFPCIASNNIKGMRVCAMGKSKNDFFYHEQKDYVGRTHYWVDVVRTPKEYNQIYLTDDKWLDDGYIIITPISADMTAYDKVKELQKLFDTDF